MRDFFLCDCDVLCVFFMSIAQLVLPERCIYRYLSSNKRTVVASSYLSVAQPRSGSDSDIPCTAECETTVMIILAQLSILDCCEYDPTNGIASIQCCALTGCTIIQSRDSGLTVTAEHCHSWQLQPGYLV